MVDATIPSAAARRTGRERPRGTDRRAADGDTPPMAESGAISIRDLRVRRGGSRVLDALSVDVPAGQVTGLLGPSGGGKSTVMRAIVGVQTIESGAVEVLGRRAG